MLEAEEPGGDKETTKFVTAEKVCFKDDEKEGDARDRHGSGASSGSTDSSSSISLPTPPDGQWGWVIVFASFMAHLIADGCAYSFGVLFEELLDYFGESTAKTAMVGSLFVSVPSITAPIASALTNRYGCRKVTMAGGLLAGFGMIISSFATSIEMLCLTYGVIAGFGFAMVYVPAVVIVAFYFEKRRAFATGIAVAGSGIGTFIFAPLTERLIHEYSWNGALLIIGGLVLNIAVCGACFRPLESQKLLRERERLRKSQEKFSRISSRVDIEEVKAAGKAGVATHNGGHGHHLLLVNGGDLYEPMTHSLVQFPTYLQKSAGGGGTGTGTELIIRDLELGGGGGRANGHPGHNIMAGQRLLEDYDSAVHSASELNITLEGGSGEVTGCPGDDDRAERKAGKAGEPWEKQMRRKMKKIQESDQFLPLHRKDIFYRGSLMRSGFFMGNGRATSCPDIFVHSEAENDGSLARRCNLLALSREVKHVFREMLDMSLFRSVLFVYFCVHSMLLYLAYDNPYVYLPHQATGLGITAKHSSYLLSIIGIVSTAGQIFMGFIGDQPHIDTLHFYNAMTTIAGVITLCVPLLKNYVSLAVYCAGYGFFISANYALTTIILVHLLGMEKLTNAYGLVSLSEGISTLVGPPLAGWLYDVTGSLDPTFYFTGAVIIAAGTMLFAVPCLRTCDKLYQEGERKRREQAGLDSAEEAKGGEPGESCSEPDLAGKSSAPCAV